MHSEYIYKEDLVTLNIDITEVKGCGNTYRKKKDRRNGKC